MKKFSLLPIMLIMTSILTLCMQEDVNTQDNIRLCEPSFSNGDFGWVVHFAKTPLLARYSYGAPLTYDELENLQTSTIKDLKLRLFTLASHYKSIENFIRPLS